MKKALFSALSAAAMAIAVLNPAWSQATHQASGVVKKIDRDGGKVTLAHGPVKTLEWPAMTMAFTVQDKVLLERLSPEKKVDFEFVKEGRKYVITSVK